MVGQVLTTIFSACRPPLELPATRKDCPWVAKPVTDSYEKGLMGVVKGGRMGGKTASQKFVATGDFRCWRRPNHKRLKSHLRG
jgi:hypothetical protein